MSPWFVNKKSLSSFSEQENHSNCASNVCTCVCPTVCVCEVCEVCVCVCVCVCV